MDISQAWWEQRLREQAMKSDGNAAAIIFAMKNRFTKDWRDKQELEHTGRDGEAIEFRDTTDLERAKAMALLIERAKADDVGAALG